MVIYGRASSALSCVRVKSGGGYAWTETVLCMQKIMS